MKIRQGFVSNSSSSSFVIVGTKIKKTMESCEKLCKKYLTLTDEQISFFTEKTCCGKEVTTKFCPECGKKSEDIVAVTNWIDVFDEYRYEIEGIDIHDDGYGCDDVVVGKYLSIDLEGCSRDVDKLIEEMQDTKTFVEKMNIGRVEFYCGITYN